MTLADGPRTPAASRIEWPTIAVAVAIAIGLAVTATVRLPAVLTIVLIGLLVAWYGSLRHEVVHGHPTPWTLLNDAIVAAPLGLTEPFWHYRADHLRHHASDELTTPGRDPESQYVSAAAWERMSPLSRRLRVANTTLAGRMVIGPWIATAAVVRDLTTDWRHGRRRAAIVRFLLADAAVLVAVAAVGVPVWQYVIGAAYVATSLTLVRSFAEHRAVEAGSRTAVVHAHGFWAMLFLNNNLHVTHHRRPALAWYQLPGAHATSDADEVAAAGAGLYPGYSAIFRRFLFRPVGPVVDPLDRDTNHV